MLMFELERTVRVLLARQVPWTSLTGLDLKHSTVFQCSSGKLLMSGATYLAALMDGTELHVAGVGKTKRRTTWRPT
jgi:hypothetical protein